MGELPAQAVARRCVIGNPALPFDVTASCGRLIENVVRRLNKSCFFKLT
jgi:hypothetical protein